MSIDGDGLLELYSHMHTHGMDVWHGVEENDQHYGKNTFLQKKKLMK